MIAIISPKTTYKIDIFIPKNPANNNSDATSTIDEDIKNENVTPRGNPALLKPINIGILEQEQNGVTVPKSAETVAPDIPLNLVSIFLVLSGGK